MEPLLHFIFPFTVLSVLGLNLKWSFLCGVIGVLPDLDVLFHTHRSISHSLIFPLTIILLFKFVFLKKPNALNLTFYSMFSWISHIFLDFFSGFTPVLWPISKSSYLLVLGSKLHVGNSPIVSFNFQIVGEPYNHGVFQTLDALLVTSEGLAIALFLTLLVILVKKSNNLT